MFKKLLFSFTATALVFSVIGTNTFAVYEDELCEVIGKSFARKSEASPKKVEDSETKETSYWDYMTPLSSSLGSMLRTGGDYIRGKGMVSDLVTDHALSSLKGVTASSDKVVERVETMEGGLDLFRNTLGNSMRWMGACFQETSKTLARDLRDFWISGVKVIDKPDLVFSSTATALVMNMRELSGADGVVLEYIKFVNSWNSSSFSTHEKREEYIHEHFIKGLLRALARTGTELKDFEKVSPFLMAFGLDLGNLVLTKKITAETVFPIKEVRESKSVKEIEEAVREHRIRIFMEFASQEIKLAKAKLLLKESDLFPALTVGPKPVLSLEYEKDKEPENMKKEEKEEKENSDLVNIE